VKLVWTKRALRELDQILAFVARDSRSAAAALVDLVEKRSAVLITHPEIGRPGRSDGTRELVLTGTPYIVPYRVRDGRVEILAVLHTSRQWPDKL
jgi:toxin ParE1/3/4